MEPVMNSKKEWKKKKLIHRAGGIFLSAIMIFHMLSTGGMATYASENTEGLCEHHPEHTAECGYIAGGCAHEHTSECYQTVTKCVHTHTEDCFSKSVSGNGTGSADAEGEGREPVNCTHVCSEESGCITKEIDCRHEHKVNGGEADGEGGLGRDENCGYVEGQPCTYDCRICSGEDGMDTLSDGATEENVQTVRKQLARDSQSQNTVEGDLDFSNENPPSGELDINGYHWDATSKTLSLKNVTISGTVTVPDSEVRIETEGDCVINELSAGNSPQQAKLIFSGTGNLTINTHIEISGANENTLMIEENAHVKVIDGISIGTSGGVDSVITVKGTLTVTGISNWAINAGKVIVNKGGTLNVSGKEGILLNGMSGGADRDYTGVFTVEEGGCFTANCTEYNVKVQSAGTFPDGITIDQVINVPEEYLPTDCEPKEKEVGSIDFVRKSTGEVYTGPMTIHENHDWPKDWNGKDENEHWKVCTFEGCGKIQDNSNSPHNFGNTNECECGAQLSITLAPRGESLIYNGQARKPDVDVKVDIKVDIKELDASKYDIVYKNNTNAGEASVIVTGKDGLTFEQILPFHISKAVPTIAWDNNNTMQTVTYSGSPAAITPPVVTLVNNENFELNYSYTADGSTEDIPGLPVSVGTYTVKASIEEQANYTAADSSNKLTLTINKAKNPLNMPPSAMNVAWKYKIVSAVELPTDWQWQEADQNIALEVGVPVTATAVYNGADRDNYDNVTGIITITRSNCNHENTELRNMVAATCLQKGYSGDTYCLDCGELLVKGTPTDLADHSGGTATCVSGKICTVCGIEYTPKDSNVHIHTEIHAQKDAACITEGYTGDTFCTDCGTKIRSGTVIPATGHDWHVTSEKEATTTAEGERIYTCSICEATRKEAIPKLPEASHTHSYSARETKAATCTENGVMTYTCSCQDSYTESIPALGHNYVSKITLEPTVSMEGIMTYTCSRCNDTYTELIDRLKDTSSKPGRSRKSGSSSGKDDSGSVDQGIIQEETDKAEAERPAAISRSSSVAASSISKETNTDAPNSQTEQSRPEEEVGKVEDESPTAVEEDDPAVAPLESEEMNDGSTSSQTEQSRMPWWLILIIILLILLGLGLFFIARKNKDKKDEEPVHEE